MIANEIKELREWVERLEASMGIPAKVLEHRHPSITSPTGRNYHRDDIRKATRIVRDHALANNWRDCGYLKSSLLMLCDFAGDHL